MMFSIVTPTWNRADGRMERCLDSAQAQRFRDFEHVVVDDGSTDGTEALCMRYPVRYLKVAHGGRVIARNVGMQAAEGEWIAHLDSDDALDMMYLATFADFIQHEPDARLIVCGAVVHGVRKDGGKHTVPAWTKLRPAWAPPFDETGQHMHDLFASGRVGTGMFAFRRDCLETTGYLPPWNTPYEVADGLDEWLGVPPGASGYGSGAPGTFHSRLVGDPWGEDHALYQKLAMHFQVHPIEACLYVQYVR